MDRVKSNRQFGRRECDTKVVKKSERLLIVAAWLIGIILIVLHSVWAVYKFIPTDTWIEYHGVVPAKEVFDVNDRLRFISHTSLNRSVEIEFTDILYCRDPFASDFERWYVNSNRRVHHDIGKDKYTTFVFTPGVPYETECYLDTHIILHLPLDVERHLHYNGLEMGHTFQIKINQEKLTETCIDTLLHSTPSANKPK